MTTSSFERNRCTRISPSAVLDDRLDGKDLEWARDHLRRCEACRDRVEDFREMLLRVGRLPSAAVSPAAMDEAFALSIPQPMRAEAGSRSYEMAPASASPTTPAPSDLPPPVRPEVGSIPDLLTELEREIFRDEPAQDHPTRLSATPEPLYPTMAESAEEIEPVKPAEPVEPLAFDEPEPMEAVIEPEAVTPAPAESFPDWLRKVPVDSHREAEPVEWARDTASAEAVMPWRDVPAPVMSDVVFDQEPALAFDGEAETPTGAPPRKSDTAMRIAVGLGAAACVLLAAVLYEGGWLLKATRPTGSTAATAATASVRPSPTIRPSASPSLSPSAAAAPVLFTLGNGVSGGTVFRIRPGTAVAGYTRLVFDMHGAGLPTMVVTQPDALHVAVTFKDTSVAGVPVNGISSSRVAAVEPGVQQGQDGTITVDLARPVRVEAFTLPATGGYAWRLVLDLHSP